MHSVRSQYPNESFAVACGVGANVTLLADYADVTGSHVLKAAHSHKPNMQSAVLGWFQALEMRALNSKLSWPVPALAPYGRAVRKDAWRREPIL